MIKVKVKCKSCCREHEYDLQQLLGVNATSSCEYMGHDSNSELPIYRCIRCGTKKFGHQNYCSQCGADIRVIVNKDTPKFTYGEVQNGTNK